MKGKFITLAPLIEFTTKFFPGVYAYSKNRYLAYLFFCFFSFSSLLGYSQETQVNATIDTSQIKIGEQIIYGIKVETDSTNLVVFPDGKSFAPMEVVEALKTDTTKSQNRFTLLKKYALTKFDSGSYTIPQQKVLVNEQPFLTDSLKVQVATVVVDTTKQKMYPIKPAMEVPQGFVMPQWVWWVLAALILLGVAFYFFRRKRKREAEAQLPPYERALFELKQLDESHLLENRQTKEYYSKLTEAVRRYLEDEVHLRAMESTSSELITYLQLKMSAGELKLSQQTVDDLKKILQRADLAKFANSRPDIITAKEDRSKIEHVITDTKAGIPEPTEEELLQDELYRQNSERRKKQRKIAVAAISAILIIGIGVTALISFKGVDYFKDLVFGSTSKELLQGEWISSDYGEPAVSIATPKVLKRGELKMNDSVQQMMAGGETFKSGSLTGDLYVVLNTVKLRQNAKFDLQNSVDGVYNYLENKGAKNIVSKHEDFTTIHGIDGIKVYGSMDIKDPESGKTEKKEYAILNFAQNGGFQQIIVIYDNDDKYLDEIQSRIINSVEFENASS